MIIYASVLKSSHGSFITGSFRVSSATNYGVKKAIYTIREQPPFFPTFSLRVFLTHTHTRRTMKNAHKHPAHYAKAPAAGNTSPTGWQEGEERKSGGEGGGGRPWLVGWVGE